MIVIIPIIIILMKLLIIIAFIVCTRLIFYDFETYKNNIFKYKCQDLI